ncbi:recombinase family protein [Leekyejoonella antrihumi]|uniref:recombinase family protein n=1 Tax=Leekyejoonella antrihumi TaxID=1660198 RepID=UPI001FEB6CD6|nr:recombinase family protein [Leekyejoonella antrihumi]
MFQDRLSGKSRAQRTGLAELLEWVREGDTVRVASMDRLARSVIDLAQIVAQLTDKGVSVEFVSERLEFRPGADDPYATFQLHLIGAVAELERSPGAAARRHCRGEAGDEVPRPDSQALARPGGAGA